MATGTSMYASREIRYTQHTGADGYAAYQQATGAVLDDQGTGLLKITQAQYDNLQNLDFEIGGVTYTLTPNAQIWPVSLLSNNVVRSHRNR